jgi:DNA polymerase III delta prime subunit
MSSTFLNKLLTRLKQGDARSIHLNALPGNFGRLDVYDFINIEQSLHLSFLSNLLTHKKFAFSITIEPHLFNNKTQDEKKIIHKIIKKINHLEQQDKEGFAEHGYHSFAFGYPLLIKRDPNNWERILKAPLFIWYLKIEKDTRKNNTWTIRRDEDQALVFNELLRAHFENNEKIKTDELDILLDDGFLTEDELKMACQSILQKLNVPFIAEENIATLLPCTNKETIESITKESPWLRWCGVFGLYKVQKQSIIKDIEDLLAKNSKNAIENIENERVENKIYDGEILSPITLDPSQENVLFQLKDTNKIIIQGPPGTGKSQSLTALITQALLNKQKVLVVCEKRTAMDVLYNNLKKENLHHLSVLVEDIHSDRKNIVETVRNLIETIDQSVLRFRENEYEMVHAKFLSLQEEINHRINFNHKIIFGDDNWNELIHRSILLNKDASIYSLVNTIPKYIQNSDFKFSYEEFIHLNKELNKAINLQHAIQKKVPAFDTIQQHKIEETSVSDAILSALSKEEQCASTLLKYIENNQKIFGENYNQLTSWRKYLVSFMSIFLVSYKAIQKAQHQTFDDYNHLKNELQKNAILTNRIGFADTLTTTRIADLQASLNQIKETNSTILQDAAYFETYFQFQKNYLSHQKHVQQLLNIFLNFEHKKIELIFETYYIQQVILKTAFENGINDSTEKLLQELTSIDNLLKQKLSERIQFIWHEMAKLKIKNCNISELKYLYNQRKNKQFSSKNSLRKIIHQDFDFFTSLFPVVMVNPSAAASILPLQENSFDYIIFDEASQLRLEDTYSSLYRGRIKIVSGDKHQMPPTNFFGSEVLFWSEQEDETTADDFLAESKSLLEYADDINYKSTYLDYHYRSKHPSLIQFSNHAFYQSRLIPMPENTPYQAIHYKPVNGIYTDGTNQQEAHEIVDFIYNIQTINQELPSIGIATFNIYQRDLILEKLYEVAYSDVQKNEHLQQLWNKGLFVKNLENIQGDERDIMLLSTTFGKDEVGNFKQLFGPINQQKGYQLLNVIITRAKHSLHVFTSIPETVFMKFETELLEKGNTGKAIFYAYLAYVKACSEQLTDQHKFVLSSIAKQENNNINKKKNQAISPLKQYVFDILKLRYKDAVKMDFELGGFNLDIVLLKDQQPILYLDINTIENYHSEVAYRNKIHQASILNNYNIKTYTIWPFNWWNNEASELENIHTLIS